MSGGYVIMEYDALKEDFPKFQNILASARANLIADAEDDWGRSLAV